MFGLPATLIALIAFMFGCIFGSFFDVFTLRFHTGKSINGRSHCLSCGHELNWYELFPIFSYVFLRGRCRVCHAHIPVRLFFMEVITGALFAFVALSVTTPAELLLGLFFISLTIIVTLYDMKHMVIPNVFVWVYGAWAIAVLGFNVWSNGQWGFVLPALVSAVVASSFYFTLWLVSKGKWIGLGDAKLALPIAAVLTPAATFSFVVLSFWVGAIVSVGLLATQYLLRRGQTYLRFSGIPLTMKSEVPFAPFLLAAFILVYYLHLDVLSLFVFTP